MISDKLKSLIKKQILVIDGGFGTMLQKYQLTSVDFGGEEFLGCNDYLVLTRPNIVEEVHRAYLKSGADIIETNTFGASSIVLAEYGLEDKTREINFKAAKIAKKCCLDFENRFVAGSMGPTTKSLVIANDVTFEELKESYYQQALGLIEGGVDCIFVETIQDTLNMKSAVQAIRQAEHELSKSVPLFISTSISVGGRMLAGQDIESFYNTARSFNPLAIGMNCAVGPKDLSEPLSILNSISDIPIFIFPNAGLPNEFGEYDENPETFASHIKKYSDAGLLNLVGGCCGTTPEHIEVLKAKIDKFETRKIPIIEERFMVSGVNNVSPDEKIRPIFVGERSNVQGSRKFRSLIREKKYDQALDIIRSQVNTGAQIIDICLEDTEIDEIEVIREFYPRVAKAIKVPIMIDSTNPKAVEIALQYCQGKSIINSINLESGIDRLRQYVEIIKSNAATAVVGLIDENGMALTFDHKMKLASRLIDILVNEYDISPQDLIFDMLVFTVETGGDKTYAGTAKATIDAIQAFKKKYPKIMTILGISNISFGLPPAGREVLNSVYLYHCVQAGLDLAIVNPAILKRYNSIPEEEISLAEDVIMKQTSDSLSKFIIHFRNKTPREEIISETNNDLTPSESLRSDIVMGTKGKIKYNLEKLLETLTPLEIINSVIMVGMAEVGKLFGEAKLIVTEVLQSAEVVKESISILESLFPQSEAPSKTKFLIATVKGDVHDIGKNLVRIIFESNGYEVIDLGTRIDSRQLIDAIAKYQPDLIGLSGLLVKSSRYMVTVAEELKKEGHAIPIIVGGAALTSKFVEKEIKPVAAGDVFYAKDAMSGLAIINNLFKKDQNS